MDMNIIAPGYIDPNTSQHVFSLLGPLLACLAAMGGMAVTTVVCVRHRIASFFRRTSWMGRIAAACMVIGVLAILAALTWWIVK